MYASNITKHNYIFFCWPSLQDGHFKLKHVRAVLCASKWSFFHLCAVFFGINSVNPKGRNPTLQVGSHSFSSSLIALLFGRQINYYVRKTVTFGPIQNQVIQSASQYLITFWLNYYFSSLLLRLTSFHQLNFSNEICLPICLISVITVCDEFKSVTLDLLPKDNKYIECI